MYKLLDIKIIDKIKENKKKKILKEKFEDFISIFFFISIPVIGSEVTNSPPNTDKLEIQVISIKD